MENKGKSYFAPFLAMVFLLFVVGFLTTANSQFQAPLKDAFLSNAGTLKNTFATLITFSWFIVLFGEVMMFLYARIGSKVRQTADQ